MTGPLIRTVLALINMFMIVGIFAMILTLTVQLRQFFTAATALLIALDKELKRRYDDKPTDSP